MDTKTILVAGGAVALFLLWQRQGAAHPAGASTGPSTPSMGAAASNAANLAKGLFGGFSGGSSTSSSAPSVGSVVNAGLDKWNAKGIEMCTAKGVPEAVCSGVGNTITKAQKYAADKVISGTKKVVDKLKFW